MLKCVDRFTVCDGLLNYVDVDKKDRVSSVMPKSLREELMTDEMHSSGLSGHFVVKNLYKKLCRQYWWKGMYSVVFKFCLACLTCAAHRGET